MRIIILLVNFGLCVLLFLILLILIYFNSRNMLNYF